MNIDTCSLNCLPEPYKNYTLVHLSDTRTQTLIHPPAPTSSSHGSTGIPWYHSSPPWTWNQTYQPSRRGSPPPSCGPEQHHTLNSCATWAGIRLSSQEVMGTSYRSSIMLILTSISFPKCLRGMGSFTATTKTKRYTLGQSLGQYFKCKTPATCSLTKCHCLCTNILPRKTLCTFGH